MIYHKIFGFTVLLAATTTNFAMQQLEDHDLAQSTGQDGLTVGIGSVNGKYMLDSISLEDKDGIPSSTHDTSAAFSYILEDTDSGVGFFGGTDNDTPIATPVNLIIDANGSTPALNVAIALDANLTRIQLDPFSIALNKLDPTTKAIQVTNQRTLLKTGSDGVVIDFVSGNQVVLNMQLGNQPQKALFKFTGGSIDQIQANNLQIMSYSCVSSVCSTNDDDSLTLDLNLKATNSTGFRLAGIYIDPTTDGLIIGKSGNLDPFNLQINNLTMGDKNATIPSTDAPFDGLKNGSIGNIGLTGIQITDFKATVKGL